MRKFFRNEPENNSIARTLLLGLMPDPTGLAKFVMGGEIPHECRFFPERQKLALRHSVQLRYLKRLGVAGKISIQTSDDLKKCVRNIITSRRVTTLLKTLPAPPLAKPALPTPVMPLTKTAARAELERLQAEDCVAAGKYYDANRILILSSGGDTVTFSDGRVVVIGEV